MTPGNLPPEFFEGLNRFDRFILCLPWWTTLPIQSGVIGFSVYQLIFTEGNNPVSVSIFWFAITVATISIVMTTAHRLGLPWSRGGLHLARWPARKLVQPRWIARVWAKLFGYFWLPCPVCQEPFAGFEWGAFSMMTGPHAGTGACAKAECQAVAEKSTRNYYTSQGLRFVSGYGGIIITVPLEPHVPEEG